METRTVKAAIGQLSLKTSSEVELMETRDQHVHYPAFIAQNFFGS